MESVCYCEKQETFEFFKANLMITLSFLLCMSENKYRSSVDVIETNFDDYYLEGLLHQENTKKKNKKNKKKKTEESTRTKAIMRIQ